MKSDVILIRAQFPFYIFQGYADKRLRNLSAIQLGTDVCNFSKLFKKN